MFRLLLAVLAFVWGAFLAPDDNGDDDGNEDGNNNENNDDKPKSDAKWTDKDLDKYKGDARKEGRESGSKAEREKQAKALGVPVEELDATLADIAEKRKSEQSDLQRMEGKRDEWKERAETAEARVSELEGSVKSRDRKDAILTALKKANYGGNENHAAGVINASFADKVKEEDGNFDASEAVKALSDDGFPGFEEPLNDPPNLERRRRKGNDDGKSYARKRQDQKNKRQQEAG